MGFVSYGRFTRLSLREHGGYSEAYMKTTPNSRKSGLAAVQQRRSLQRRMKRITTCFLKRQNCDWLNVFQRIMKKLQEIEDTLEIMAGEMARQARHGG